MDVVLMVVCGCGRVCGVCVDGYVCGGDVGCVCVCVCEGWVYTP